ncbi:MAG: BlaI/MecI/CopY family transcriptional regulator [Acetatifactor sp.]|nr:BlaI/MecI/CopY family transcriptional regulator [Acetatifactor sp.]
MSQMNPRELDVLNLLWKGDEPMTAIDIVNAGSGLTQSTVSAVLRKLLNSGLVDAVGVTHSGKVLSRTYRPTEASKELILQSFTENYSSFSNVIPESSMCVAILKSNKDTKKAKEELKRLKKMLEAYEKEI